MKNVIKISVLGMLWLSTFFPVNAQFELNNDAVQTGTLEYRLTDNVLNQNGSIWYKLQLDLNEGFTISGELFFGNDDAGADGIAFVLQNNCLAAGGIGGGIGFGGLAGPNLGVEFDTYENITGSGDADNSDPAYDHIAVLRDGNVNHAALGDSNLYGPVQIHATKSDVEDSIWYPFEISFDPTTDSFKVFFDGALRVAMQIDIIDSIFAGDNYAYWGFTSATGGFANQHGIRIGTSTTALSLTDDTICNSSVTIDSLPPLTRYSGENIALGRLVTSSSDENIGALPANAVDGNNGTRWSSQFSDPQWIEIDFEGAIDIDSVILVWEGAYATEYRIQVSEDGVTWEDKFHETAGNGGTDVIVFADTAIRYIRMYGEKRATAYGYSLWEFEVYGLPKYEWSPASDPSISDIFSSAPTFSPDTTTTYTVGIPDPCNGVVNFEYTVTVNCILPNDALHLTGLRKDQVNYLDWDCKDVESGDYFKLYRAILGTEDYREITQMNVNGSSLTYSYPDNISLKGPYQYQVKQFREGISPISSNIIVLNEDKPVKAWSNEGTLFLHGNPATYTELTLYDATGRLIYGMKDIVDGIFPIPLELQSQGIYVVRIKTPYTLEYKKFWLK